MTLTDHQKLTAEDCRQVLLTAYLAGGFKTKSDYARHTATLVAAAASLGLITNLLPDNAAPTNTWRVTAKGLQLLEGN